MKRKENAKNTLLGTQKRMKIEKEYFFVNFRGYFICIFSLIVTFNHHVTTYIESHIFLLYFMQKNESCKITVFGYKKRSNSKSHNWKIFFTQKYGGFYLSDLEYGVRSHHDHLRQVIPILNSKEEPKGNSIFELNKKMINNN